VGEIARPNRVFAARGRPILPCAGLGRSAASPDRSPPLGRAGSGPEVGRCRLPFVPTVGRHGPPRTARRRGYAVTEVVGDLGGGGPALPRYDDHAPTLPTISLLAHKASHVMHSTTRAASGADVRITSPTASQSGQRTRGTSWRSSARPGAAGRGCRSGRAAGVERPRLPGSSGAARPRTGRGGGGPRCARGRVPLPVVGARVARRADLASRSDVDRHDAARRLGWFVRALRRADAAGGPPSYRGAPIRTSDAAVRARVHKLAARGVLDVGMAIACWDTVLPRPTGLGSRSGSTRTSTRRICWPRTDGLPG
jgi:hypothetical protein